MRDIKKAKNFDGISGIMYLGEFDRIMQVVSIVKQEYLQLKHCFKEYIYFNDCLDKEIGGNKYENVKSLLDVYDYCVSACEKIEQVFSTMAYFDELNKEVHIQLGYRELEYLTDIMIIYLLPEDKGNITFENCIKSPNCKKWVNKE